MNLSLEVLELFPRHAFRIARSGLPRYRNVIFTYEAEGVQGLGEAAPSAFYGETADSIAERLQAANGFIAGLRIRSVDDIERAWQESWTILAPSRAAQCALDVALWDWLARREGVSVAELARGAPPRPFPTFCTIGLSDAEELEVKLAELDSFPRIKIKSDAAADLQPIRSVRERHNALLAVDANCAWGGHDLSTLSGELRRLGVTFIEQPQPPMHTLPARNGCELPVIADESCVTEADIERVAGRFDGFNIKLVKCGGLTPALRMARRGRALGLTTMVGCMIESSLLIAAGAVVAQGTDYADLDGAWLLGADPFRGWTFAQGILTPPSRPGLGAERVTGS